jgi:beta-lactam-binding protein with PASTA domain
MKIKITREAVLARLKDRAFLAEVAAILGIVGVTSAFGFILTTRLIVKSAESVTLDDLNGRDAGDAAVWLAGHGLRAEIDHFEDNDRAAPLTVVFQDPGAGEVLRPGYMVRLVISRGARAVPVPDVRASYLSQARLILERNGLAVSDVIEVHDASPGGTVLASSPGANAPVLAGSPVRLLVSTGPAPREWIAPEITWSTFDAVQTLAASMGVTVEVGQRMHSEEAPEGVILEQFPPAGAHLVEGEPLRVTVNGDAGQAPVVGGANLVALSLAIPKGFTMHTLTVRVVRGAWIRTVFDEPVYPGDRVRVVTAILPGDRTFATLDGQDFYSRSF